MESNVTPIKFRSTANRRRRDNTAATKQGMDFLLFFAICAISLFGVVMLFSASYYKALSETGNVMGIVRNQVVYLAAGIVMMYLISLVNYNILRRKWLLIAAYAFVLLLLAATLLWGREVLGARRWLYIGSFGMQPSELVKFILVVCMAYYISTYPKRIGTPNGFVFLIAMAVPHIVLIYPQPNMSMIIIIVVLTGVMLFLGGAPWKYLGSVAGIGAVGIGVLTIVAGYRTDRITSWIDPWKDPSGKAYQVIQSMYAFANGGFLGQGFNNSRQKLLFLPEMENDYILSIIAEELGFIGVALLLAAYVFVIYRGIRIALSVKDRFGSLVAFGITCALAFQVIVNVGVVTNTIPSTGQSLPFISAGGSSLLVFFAAIGVLLNISRHMKTSKKPAFKADKE
ncbi:MAG: putative lipid II flippase FtsW [Clostridia bacterium]|nr:putative lipid II flippase FtsW [Clostridia bacterium]